MKLFHSILDSSISKRQIKGVHIETSIVLAKP